MFIQLGATGRLIKGDVLDCNKTSLERAVRDYDAQLYFKWNPKKYHGYGCWELRRRPEKKTVSDVAEFDGHLIFKVDYVENDLENHVKDLGFLDYRVIDWLKTADTWKQVNYEASQAHRSAKWVKDLEDRESAHRDSLQAKVKSEALYGMRQNKTAIRQYKEAILSGTNPALLAKYWK